MPHIVRFAFDERVRMWERRARRIAILAMILVQDTPSPARKGLSARSFRIASVYRSKPLEESPEHDAAIIWWKRLSEGLAAHGHLVDVVAGPDGVARQLGPRLRTIPFPAADWPSYDVILTFFHQGFDHLARAGGLGHPRIVSSLGSVVGSSDETPGVYFFGERRRWLHQVQEQIAGHSRFINVLTEPSRDLWIRTHGRAGDVVVIPQGVDRQIPEPRETPYRAYPEPIAVYVGTIYNQSQKEMNLVWQERLNLLGRALRRRGIRLCLIGLGDRHLLDGGAVTYLGAVDNALIWDYHYFAAAGVILAHGPVQHNESTKLYYYLRAGLPVVSEAPVPNNHVLEEAQLGILAPFGDEERLAELVADAQARTWDRARAQRYMVEHHSWDLRVARYEELIGRALVDRGGILLSGPGTDG
jgi:glycosyltransferase involved in cell wall biosynthesis